MSEHTPGPWAVTHEDDFDGLVIEAAGREGEYVPVACVPVDYDDRPEREANAALIARAPEMAAEIERLTARVDELEGALAVRPRKPRRIGGEVMIDLLEVIAKLKDALWHQYGNVLQKQYSQHEIHMTYYVSTLLDNTGLGPDNDYRYTQQSVSAAFIAGLRVGEKNAKEMADTIVKDRLADAIAALEGKQ